MHHLDMFKSRLWIVVAALCFTVPNIWAGVIVDRGLPAQSVNIPGSSRSNVDWWNDDGTFVGDDFTIPGSGSVRISSIRVWFDECPFGTFGTSCNFLQTVDVHGIPNGQFHSTVSLYTSIGTHADTTLRATGNFTATGTDNPNITITPVSYPSASGQTCYLSDIEGGCWQLFALDFNNLNWVVPKGTPINFAVLGTGTAALFVEGTNASTGGVRADSADGYISSFNSDGTFNNSTYWNSDLNVQAFDTAAVPTLSAWGMAGLAVILMAAGCWLLRRPPIA